MNIMRTVPQSNSVFKDKERLLPDFPIEKHWNSLPYREEQIQSLWNIYSSILDKPFESHLRVTQIIGPTGTGKSCTARFFGDAFEREAIKKKIALKHIYINLKLEGGRRVILYRNLLGKIEPSLVSASLSSEEMLKNLVQHLQRTKQLLLLTIDEVDYYVTHFREEGVVYDLTRLGELSRNNPSGLVGIIFLARDDRFHEALDPGELSTLGRLTIRFSAYKMNQIAEILEKRAHEALHQGACSPEIFEFIGDVTFRPPINGDMRYALDLLLYAGNLADNLGSKTILPEHVRSVHSESNHLITAEDILNVTAEEKLILMAMGRTLRNKRTPYVSLKEIRTTVKIVSEEVKSEPIMLDNIDDYIQDLADRGIVDIKGISRIGINDVALESIEKFFESMTERAKQCL
jgi:cell division control protein 6